jgi:hypothetical protein
MVELKDLLIGQQVTGSDFGQYRITDRFQRLTSEIFTIKSRLRADPLKCTPDHEFLAITYQDYKKRCFVPRRIKASQLKKKDLLLMPKPPKYDEFPAVCINWEQYYGGKGPKSADILPPCLKLSDDILWMLGLWIAEGCIGGEREIVFTLHINELDLALRAEQALLQISDQLNVQHHEKPEVNTRLLTVCNSALARWIVDQCGSGCDQKRMPKFFEVLSPRQQLILVYGIWAGDGSTIHRDKDRAPNRRSIGMTARTVLHRAQITLWQNGFRAGLSTYKLPDRKRVYTLEWIDESYKATRQFYEFEEYWATAITEITYKKCPVLQPVYDITVEDNHAFVVNNTLSHNCFGEGYLWDEEDLQFYRVLEDSDVDNALRDKLREPGLINVPLIVFYIRYDSNITRYDKIVQLVLDNAGDPVTPYQRKGIYRVNAAWDYRSDNGKLEYWKVFTHQEHVKYLNSPSYGEV